MRTNNNCVFRHIFIDYRICGYNAIVTDMNFSDYNSARIDNNIVTDYRRVFLTSVITADAYILKDSAFLSDFSVVCNNYPL